MNVLQDNKAPEPGGDGIIMQASEFFNLNLSLIQTEGYEYLRESCTCVLTELLEYVVKTDEHSIINCRHASKQLDGSDNKGRRSEATKMDSNLQQSSAYDSIIFNNENSLTPNGVHLRL
ncbi:hypothetical protein EJ110_NYTH27682 [Nymphaea thermarum]|nr:hypothetical protein EJ110_NYTH27682 [Nymphaea thermarum]